MKTPRERLAAFLEAEKLSQADAGELFGCTQTAISKILRGERTPGLTLAFAIESKTKASEHAVEAREWLPPAEPLEATGTEG